MGPELGPGHPQLPPWAGCCRRGTCSPHGVTVPRSSLQVGLEEMEIKEGTREVRPVPKACTTVTTPEPELMGRKSQLSFHLHAPVSPPVPLSPPCPSRTLVLFPSASGPVVM